jgi:hypothetical protein
MLQCTKVADFCCFSNYLKNSFYGQLTPPKWILSQIIAFCPDDLSQNPLIWTSMDLPVSLCSICYSYLTYLVLGKAIIL